MGIEGLEPSPARAEQILSLPCIPFHHTPRMPAAFKSRGRTISFKNLCSAHNKVVGILYAMPRFCREVLFFCGLTVIFILTQFSFLDKFLIPFAGSPIRSSPLMPAAFKSRGLIILT